MLYKDNTTKLMGLEETIVERVEETETEHHIYLEMCRKEHPCPQCGERTNKIHDYREQKIRDLPAFGKKTFLHLRKRRYRCPECGKRFCENVPFLQKQHQTTTRVVESRISSYREMKTSKRIAEEHDVSATTAQRYFDTVSIRFKCLPVVLSIDEFRGNAGGEKFQCILTDPQNHKTSDILPNRKSCSLMKYFQGFSTRKSMPEHKLFPAVRMVHLLPDGLKLLISHKVADLGNQKQECHQSAYSEQQQNTEAIHLPPPFWSVLKGIQKAQENESHCAL